MKLQSIKFFLLTLIGSQFVLPLKEGLAMEQIPSVNQNDTHQERLAVIIKFWNEIKALQASRTKTKRSLFNVVTCELLQNQDVIEYLKKKGIDELKENRLEELFTEQELRQCPTIASSLFPVMNELSRWYEKSGVSNLPDDFIELYKKAYDAYDFIKTQKNYDDLPKECREVFIESDHFKQFRHLFGAVKTFLYKVDEVVRPKKELNDITKQIKNNFNHLQADLADKYHIAFYDDVLWDMKDKYVRSEEPIKTFNTQEGLYNLQERYPDLSDFNSTLLGSLQENINALNTQVQKDMGLADVQKSFSSASKMFYKIFNHPFVFWGFPTYIVNNKAKEQFKMFQEKLISYYMKEYNASKEKVGFFPDHSILESSFKNDKTIAEDLGAIVEKVNAIPLDNQDLIHEKTNLCALITTLKTDVENHIAVIDEFSNNQNKEQAERDNQDDKANSKKTGNRSRSRDKDNQGEGLKGFKKKFD